MLGSFASELYWVWQGQAEGKRERKWLGERNGQGGWVGRGKQRVEREGGITDGGENCIKRWRWWEMREVDRNKEEGRDSLKGKVGGSVQSCEAACHRGSIWRRPWGKHGANCHSFCKREECLCFTQAVSLCQLNPRDKKSGDKRLHWKRSYCSCHTYLQTHQLKLSHISHPFPVAQCWYTTCLITPPSPPCTQSMAMTSAAGLHSVEHW